MPRSPMDHWVYTSWPDLTASFVLGGLDIIAVPDLSEEGQTYTGRMLLHASGYPEADPECARNLEAMGLSVDTFPGYAIHGRATVKSISTYKPMVFAAEYERHGNGADMQAWLKASGILDKPDVWRIELKDVEALEAPIINLYGDPVAAEDGIYRHGDLWQPSSPMIMEAVKMAINKDRAVIPAE